MVDTSPSTMQSPPASPGPPAPKLPAADGVSGADQPRFTRAGQPYVTFEEFVEWYDEGRRGEWVDGEIVPMSPARAEHQRLMFFLAQILSIYAEAHQLGEVMPPPFLMRLATRPSGREPDLLFIARENAGRLQDAYLDGPADLAVEITSPDSSTRDRGDKFTEYETAGVREYWLIDPRRREARFYQLQSDGVYRSIEVEANGVYQSVVLPDFRLPVAWLWQRPLPKVDDARRQLGV